MSKYLPGMSEYEKGFVDGNRAKRALQAELKANIERQARLDTYKKLIKYTQDKYQEFVTKEELEVFIKELERGE